MIRIWQRDPVRGSVDVHDACGLKNAFRSVIPTCLSTMAPSSSCGYAPPKFPNETGGVLLGYYDFNIKAVVIVAGLPAPPDSKSQPKLLRARRRRPSRSCQNANTRTAGIVNYIGEWHSHPPDRPLCQAGVTIAQLSI